MTIDRLSQALADRYRIERELGAGGMATVYLAEDLKHHRKVAIKVLRPELAATLGPDRFMQEITIAARLQHPHILPVHDSGEAGGFLYYVMPYVEGESLRERLQRQGELPVPEAVRLLSEVADALSYAHGHGVVHRDIKPENVMLSGRHALVMDFGVAKAVSEASGRNQLTTAGVALGTPAYMAPEQASADPHLDHRVDLYALGVVGYELLAGRPPFTGGSPQQVLAAQVTQTPEAITTHRPAISPVLGMVIMRALAKRPADRWQTADEMLAQLEPLTTPSGGMTPTETRPIAAVNTIAARSSRSMWLKGGLGVAVIAMVGFGLYRWNNGRGAPALGVRAPILVLPFEVQGGDASLAPLGVQVADQAAAAIEGAGIAKLVPRPSGTVAPDAFRSAVRNARAGTLITGVIQKRGDSVEVFARVIRGGDLQTVWTLGPERASLVNAATATDSIRERILGAVAAYLGPGWESANIGIYSPPRDLEAYRLYAKGDGLHRAGESVAGIPFMRQAQARDTNWLRPTLELAVLYDDIIGDDGAKRDSVLVFLEARRARLTSGEALLLDWYEARLKSPEEEYHAVQALLVTDSSANAIRGLTSSLRSGRPSQALHFYALRDTATAWGRDWQEWDVAVGIAYHELGRFVDELTLARKAKARSGRTSAHWEREVGALAAMGRGAEIDTIITASSNLEDVMEPVWLMYLAAHEFARHGFDSLARTYAGRALVGAGRWSDSLQQTIQAGNVRSGMLRILGRRTEVWREYAGRPHSSLVSGLPARILGARERIATGDTTGVLALVDSARRQALAMFPATGWDKRGDPFYFGAQLLALLGRKDEAVAMLRDALNNGLRLNVDESLQWYWKPIKDYPPFQELVRLRDDK